MQKSSKGKGGKGKGGKRSKEASADSATLLAMSGDPFLMDDYILKAQPIA